MAGEGAAAFLAGLAGRNADPRARLARTPFGTPVAISREDPGGMGDRAAGGTVFIPSGDAASEPHELMHAGIQQVTSAIPGGSLAEALVSRASDYAYGPEASQYLNPAERVAYGYQESETGQPDEGFQRAKGIAARAARPGGKSQMVLRDLLDVLGAGAERFGRGMSRR